MPSIAIGTNINGPNGSTYIITDFLGRGAFGEVYRAANEKDGSLVAVKLLPIGKLSTEEDRVALLNEIRVAGAIDHPNVVRILSVNENDDALGPYICLEYISGGTLANLLDKQMQTKQPIPIQRTIEMMIDIAQGARAINARLIHRDIKPDNLLLDGKTIKVSDFGISKFIDEETRRLTFKGGQHVSYMAPEGWMYEKNTPKLDTYSVGLVYFQILTLKHPFASIIKDPNSLLEWQNAHLYAHCPDAGSVRADCPAPVSQLIARMVSKRPTVRPDWDDVLRVLTDPSLEPAPTANSLVSRAVSAAVSKAHRLEEIRLKIEREMAENDRKGKLYEYAFHELLSKFSTIVDQFNKEFQLGRINVRNSVKEVLSGTTYDLPSGAQISIFGFMPTNGISIRGKTLAGGGWIGLHSGRSANLLLLKDAADDLYGNWQICEMSVSPIANASKLIGKYGLTKDTVQPFGLQSSIDFYDQIRFVNATHVFNYQFTADTEQYFTGLLEEGCS